MTEAPPSPPPIASTDPLPPSGASRWMTRRYVPALAGIAALVAAAMVLIHLMLAQNAAVLEVVNASGRQRMLSQQAALQVVRLSVEDDRAQALALRADLQAVLDRLTEAHERLSRAGASVPQSDRLRALYFEGPNAVDAELRRFTAAVAQVLEAPDAPTAAQAEEIVRRAEGPLLDGLDQVVYAYQQHGEAATRRLQWLIGAVGLGLVLIIAAEAAFVFRPMVRQVDRQLRLSRDMADALRCAHATLEEEVALRTRDLQRARDAAEQASRAKSRFLATVGHDLMQPVKALGIFVTALERSGLSRDGGHGEGTTAEAVDPVARSTLVDLRGALATISALIKGLLDFSRAEHGSLTAARRPVALAPILEQAAAEYRPMAENNGVALRVVRCTALVESDPVLLERILRNLIANALRYTASGRVLIGCRRHGPRLRLEVHDTGPGIAEDQQARIFGAFVRGPDQGPGGADSHEALGLGLAIVAELAAALGHETGVASTPGRGSLFWVDVPLAAACAASEGRRLIDEGMHQ